MCNKNTNFTYLSELFGAFNWEKINAPYNKHIFQHLKY